jgi:Rifampin ADP-ribosyl transferase
MRSERSPSFRLLSRPKVRELKCAPNFDGVCMENEPIPFGAHDSGPFFHGTKTDLKVGDLLEPGYSSNYGERRTANYVYLTATLDAATWGAELAVGEDPAGFIAWSPRALSKMTPT